jgi:hypothetical protein
VNQEPIEPFEADVRSQPVGPARASLGLAIAAGMHLVSGCYDDCGNVGHARCAGSIVQICGYASSDFPSWDDLTDCDVFSATCSIPGPGDHPEVYQYCVLPDFECDAGPVLSCHKGNILRCEAAGSPARLYLPCTNGCIENGDSPFCGQAPPEGSRDAGR